jgi:hypothetical protein
VRAEYVVNKLTTQPAFLRGGFRLHLKSRNRIIAAVNNRYVNTQVWCRNALLNQSKAALELDEKNGNKLWFEAINKEMKNVKVASATS